MEALTLAKRFEIPDALRFERGSGGLVHAVISTPAAEADLYLQGAHLASWTPRGQRPVLFLSPRSLVESGKAIRGGVPIIFPWFGARTFGASSDKPAPAHGFARTAEWAVESAHLREDGGVEITLALFSSEATREFFDAAFQLRFRLTVGSELAMELEAINTGEAPFAFEEALHTYLSVGDVRETAILGLENTVFIDKTDRFSRKAQDGEPVRVAREVDQVHVGTQSTCTVSDPVWNRRIIVEKSGSNSTVIWNPWVDKTKSMSDMDADGWKQMLCVESANAADNVVVLSPGASHKLTVRIRVE